MTKYEYEIPDDLSEEAHAIVKEDIDETVKNRVSKMRELDKRGLV